MTFATHQCSMMMTLHSAVTRIKLWKNRRFKHVLGVAKSDESSMVVKLRSVISLTRSLRLTCTQNENQSFTFYALATVMLKAASIHVAPELRVHCCNKAISGFPRNTQLFRLFDTPTLLLAASRAVSQSPSSSRKHLQPIKYLTTAPGLGNKTYFFFLYLSGNSALKAFSFLIAHWCI